MQHQCTFVLVNSNSFIIAINIIKWWCANSVSTPSSRNKLETQNQLQNCNKNNRISWEENLVCAKFCSLPELWETCTEEEWSDYERAYIDRNIYQVAPWFCEIFIYLCTNIYIFLTTYKCSRKYDKLKPEQNVLPIVLICEHYWVQLFWEYDIFII